MPSFNDIARELSGQEIELPSWAFGNSGTRFKVFARAGVPRNPFEKIADAARAGSDGDLVCDIANDNVRQLQDVNLREFGILASLAIVVLLFGLWPAPLVEVMHASVDNLLIHLSASKLPPETGLALLQTVTP